MSLAAHPSFAATRDEIVGQHARLRLRMDLLDAAAEDVVRCERCGRAEITRMLDQLVHELAAHMAFEEGALSRASIGADAWDAHDLVRLGKEHDRQRQELIRITREALHADDPISLALAIRAFIADVRLDMSMEEERLQRQGVSAR